MECLLCSIAILGVGDTTANKTDESACLGGAYIVMERDMLWMNRQVESTLCPEGRG